MAKVIITQELKNEVFSTFKNQSVNVFERMKSLEERPHTGKSLTSVDGIVIKELKYETFRFYFLTDGHILKFGTQQELAILLITFIRMSKKKDQQKTIDEIIDILKSFGSEAF